MGIDLADLVERKIRLNEKKYPAELVRGSSKKYTEYNQE
jgi:dCTP diphosphatase